LADVTIYTRDFCGYCTRALALLRSKDVEFTEIDAGNDFEKRREMIQRSGGRNTFPQIFINGEHVGGSDDLFALDARGGLDPLLERA
jgi:glutaredoxin 3